MQSLFKQPQKVREFYHPVALGFVLYTPSKRSESLEIPSAFGQGAIRKRSEVHSRRPATGAQERHLLQPEMDAATAPAQKRTPANDAVTKVWSMCQNIVGSPIEFVPDASLADLGIDELGLAELLFQIGQEFGEGLVSVEDVSPLHS